VRARSEGANVVLTGRNAARLQRAGNEVDALSTAAFDATDPDQLERFFQDLPDPIDHVMVTAGGSYYASLAEMDFEKVRRSLDEHLLLTLHVARQGGARLRPGARSCSWPAPAPADQASASRLPRFFPLHSQPSRPTWTYDIDGGEQLVSGA